MVLTLVGAAALVVAAGVAVRVVSESRPSEFTAEYTQTAVWDGGLIGGFIVSNPSERAASDWKISFSLPQEARLAGVWNAVLAEPNAGTRPDATAHPDATYVIKPTDQNKTVGARRSVTIGLTAVGGRPVVPRNCTINGKACKVQVTTAGLAAAPGTATDQFGAAVAPGLSTEPVAEGASDQAGTGDSGPRRPGGSGGGRGTLFTPYVNLTDSARPPLKAIADVSGSAALTLASALPPSGGGCDLRWGGAAEPGAYAKEIRDALNSGIALIASVGAGNGVDVARACGSADAIEAQVREVLDLGVRSVDITIAGGSLADSAANARLAQAVGKLKARYSGLTVSYTLPAASSGGATAPETLVKPLAAAKSAGTVLDRVNILPVDVAAPLDVLKPLLGTGTPRMVDSLLTAATGVHDQIMRIQGADSARAWRMLGIVPVIDAGDLAHNSSELVGSVNRLAGFARSRGLSLVGFLPLNTGQVCVGGLVGGLLAPVVPLLGCVDPASLSGFFAISDGFNRALR
ncbi:cellulose binding domain-containing protein [Planosporangium mesophilum]|uniref:CBM2 domain-containing protein n=2 Tax=Planosporangium mesophilum TaxID=689768 RepID=A0A8J3TEV3_9ACTN|nr:cellulose binding domain-containing protein [Planosporangium mesophilum]GII25014.1 hypothetical protein Pme01_46110 [Planosporangium mesophilum]